MNAEAQRIAIAEFCGWSNCGPHFNRGRLLVGHAPNLRRGEDKKHRCLTVVPNYLHDLNAMHEAEEKLHPSEIDRYAEQLYMVLERFWTPAKWVKFSRYSIDYAFAHATAAQRAEALLRTIGKWVEDEK